ncbi:hypothetical protein SAMN05661012_02559 [Chitinophaga sancti]|uniref:Uncharacterized protein n=1 Tax=Chitinophaga sancti TaxID=1004 RepID=A0A1K1QAW7_9BACT|nr:hypothetical protein SAMN05661012_02559 [Chitinophaga sancti]
MTDIPIAVQSGRAFGVYSLRTKILTLALSITWLLLEATPPSKNIFLPCKYFV